MRGHVFIVNEETFPVVRDRQFCGTGIKNIPATYGELVKSNLSHPRKPYFKLIGDLKGTRIGDLVFLYERGQGFHGVYRIASKPFFDPNVIHGVGDFRDNIVDATWPLRICIECVDYFPKPVPEDWLFSTSERGSIFWVWFYRKVQGARGCNTINPEAVKGLIELLLKLNGRAQAAPKRMPYPDADRQPLLLPLQGEDKKVPLEDILRSWLIENIDNPERKDLRQLFGPAEDIEWFANNVPYHVTQKNIDILCFHRISYGDGISLRHKFSVVELKRDRAATRDVTQTVDYSKWVAGRLASGEVEIVQPILIAHDFAKTAILRARNSDFNSSGIKLVRYEVLNGNDIQFAITFP